MLLNKPRSHAEVYNDLDDSIVNLFRVLQRPDDAARLVEMLRLIPFARREFEIAYDPVAGMVVLSGYAHPLYDVALADWRRETFDAYADGARPRTEVLWINPAAAHAREAARMPLFGVA